MKHNFHSFICLTGACACLCTSCLKNDFDYPAVKGIIQEIAVEGQQGAPEIDLIKRSIHLTVSDGYDIDSLAITRLLVNDETRIFPDSSACLFPAKFPQTGFASLDALPPAASTLMHFTKPVYLRLQTYHDYWWSINVAQPLVRTIEVENQVGSPVIDVFNKTMLVYVSKDQPLNRIKINKLQLEGDNTYITPDFTTVHDFSRLQRFHVMKTYKGGITKDRGYWRVDVVQTDSKGKAQLTERWAHKAVLTGDLADGALLGIRYRKAGDEAWTEVPASSITHPTKTSFEALISGLEDGTDYQWQTLSDNVVTAEGEFQTERISQLPNLNFDTWTQDAEGDRWYPNATADDSFWATGNSGLSVAKKPNVTVPTTDAVKGKAAKMTSTTGVILVGAAAGNLFIGNYKTNMSNPSASVSFGRPFQGARPTALAGYYKYQPAKINHPSKITPTTRPQTPLGTDQAHIYLIVWDEQGKQIGYGELTESNTVSEYKPFKFGIHYTDKLAPAARITIVATSSKYGGDFDGMKVCGQVGHGSTLYVDEFEMLYD